MVKKTNWNSGEKGSPVSMSWAFLRLRGPVCELRSIGYSSGFRIADVEMSVLRDVLEHQTVCLRSLLQYSQPHYVSEIFGRMGQGLRSAIHCVHTCITPYTPFLIS